MTQRLGSHRVKRLLSRQELRRTFRINDSTIDLWVERAWLRRTTRVDGSERFRVVDGGLRLRMQQQGAGRAAPTRKRRGSVPDDRPSPGALAGPVEPASRKPGPRGRTLRQVQGQIAPEVLAEAAQQLFPAATAQAFQEILNPDSETAPVEELLQEPLLTLVEEAGQDLVAEAVLATEVVEQGAGQQLPGDAAMASEVDAANQEQPPAPDQDLGFVLSEQPADAAQLADGLDGRMESAARTEPDAGVEVTHEEPVRAPEHIQDQVPMEMAWLADGQEPGTAGIPCEFAEHMPFVPESPPVPSMATAATERGLTLVGTPADAHSSAEETDRGQRNIAALLDMALERMSEDPLQETAIPSPDDAGVPVSGPPDLFEPFADVARHLTDLAAEVVADVEAQVAAVQGQEEPDDLVATAFQGLDIGGPELFGSSDDIQEGPAEQVVESTTVAGAFDQIFGALQDPGSAPPAEQEQEPPVLDDHQVLPEITEVADLPDPAAEGETTDLLGGLHGQETQVSSVTEQAQISVVEQLEPAFAALGARIDRALETDDLLIASVRKIDEDLTALHGKVGQTQQATASLADRIEAFGAASTNSAQTPTATVQAPIPAPDLALDPARHVVIFGSAILLLSWALVFYVQTGDLRLTLGGLVLANLAGCALLAGSNRER